VNIHLIRHGQVAGPPALYGRTDVALSDAGQTALSEATASLPPPDAIVSSPLRRCHAFAEQQAAAHNCSLHTDPGLREMDFGDWDGVPYDADSPHWPAMEAFWGNPGAVSPPNGESLSEVRARVDESWRRWENLEEHRNLWIFAHGGVIRLVLANLLNLDWRNPCLYASLHIGYASRTTVNVSTNRLIAPRILCIGLPPPDTLLASGATRAP